MDELPFAEIKLDRAFVADCGTDRVNAPLCKMVIDLAIISAAPRWRWASKRRPTRWRW
jgi:hypothetical protein